ncbi:hypothetical protein FRIG_15795, partial [Frigoribacterium faeni]|uniref:hypothetical protein n=1 Tax=Frigoribacterium faeni TaxID=145483 RepID=UPI001FAC86ED
MYKRQVKYSADLSHTYRGSTDVLVPLKAGTHSLSLRASRDGPEVHRAELRVVLEADRGALRELDGDRHGDVLLEACLLYTSDAADGGC